MLQRGEEGGGDGHLDPAGPASIAISARFAGSNDKDAGVEVEGDGDRNGGGGCLTSNKRHRQTSRQRKQTYDATKKSAEKVVSLENLLRIYHNVWIWVAILWMRTMSLDVSWIWRLDYGKFDSQ